MKYILTLLLFFSCIDIFSQTQISKKDKEIFTVFLKELNEGNVEKSIRLTDSIYTIAIEEDNKVLEILMLNILAENSVNKGDINTSNTLFLKQYNKISALSKSYIKDSLLIDNLKLHGRAYLGVGDVPKAINQFNKSLVIGKRIKDSVLISDVYNLLGNAYVAQELYDDAIFYYKECFKYDPSDDNKRANDSNLAIIYAIKKDYVLAEKYFMRQFDNVDYNDIYDLSTINFNLACLYTDMGKYQKAHTFFLKADDPRINDKAYQLENKTSLITSYTNIKDYASAKRYAKICDSLVKEIDANPLKMKLYKAIYESSSEMSDYKKAFNYSKKYMSVKDSMFNSEKTKIAKDLKIKHESDLKETEILSQKDLIETKNKQNIGLLIASSLILISMLFMFLSYRKRLLAQKELADEKMSSVLERQKVKTYESHIEGQNKERERIAKDLHDSVSGNLAAIKLKLTNLKNAQSKEIDEVILNIDATYNEVRTISHNLLPQEIITQNFTKNIEQLVTLYRSNNLKIGVEIFPEEEINKLPQKIEIELSRILQELITNITKHAQASKCNISITLHDRHLNLIVEDNGIGFNTENKSKGIGLSNILSRIQSMNGSLDIDSSIGKGTTVNINVLTN